MEFTSIISRMRAFFFRSFVIFLFSNCISHSESVARNEFTKALRLRGNPKYYRQFSNGTVELQLTRNGSAGFISRNRYFHGIFSMQMKLTSNFSVGIISTFFLTSGGSNQDEIDMEFLGHISPLKVTLHTNTYSFGDGNKHEGFRLWFDPSADFHNYTIWWDWKKIVWLVDSKPIRVFYRPGASTDSPNYVSRPLYIMGSIWQASSWATQNGLIKTDYTYQPFNVFYRKPNFRNSCVYREDKPFNCYKNSTVNSWDFDLTPEQLATMDEIRIRYLTYSYLNQDL